MNQSCLPYPRPTPLISLNLESFPMSEMISNLTMKYYFIVQFNDAIVYSYLMGVDAIDQTICPEVLGMTKCSIA